MLGRVVKAFFNLGFWNIMSFLHLRDCRMAENSLKTPINIELHTCEMHVMVKYPRRTLIFHSEMPSSQTFNHITVMNLTSRTICKCVL